MTSLTRFPGLDSLRFLAAFLVVVGHIPLNQEAVGLPTPTFGPISFRGAPAVYFFFVLSGFLITYLLLEERERTGDIHVLQFYLRRALRIWPLYLLIIAFGLLFYNVMLPALGIAYRVEYSLWLAIPLYVFFLPNLMNSLYSVGGILNPTWSIGIEEQFYLAWAPVVRLYRDRLPVICWGVLAVSLVIFCLGKIDAFGVHAGKKFVGQLKFHFIAAGALAAWSLHRRPAALLGAVWFKSRFAQLVLLFLLTEHLIIAYIQWGWFLTEILQLWLYAWLVVNVGANPRTIIPVGHRSTEYLGKISYGIYMFHMIAIYVTSQFFRSTDWWRENLPLYCVAYYAMAFALTVILSSLSFRYFETPFLRLKDRGHSANETCSA